MPKPTIFLILLMALFASANAQEPGKPSYEYIPDTAYLRYINTVAWQQMEFSQVTGWGINPMQLKSIRRHLPKDVTLLEYIPCRDYLLICMITGNSSSAVKVNVTREELKAKTKQLLDAISFQQVPAKTRPMAIRGLKVKAKKGKPVRSFESVSAELYDYLLEPVSNQIAGKKYISVAAYSVLANLPFQLVGKKDAAGMIRFAGDDHSFFYINDLETFRRIGERSASESLQHIVCLGNPDGTLPSAEKEVKAIQQIYPSAMILTGKNAIADTLYRIPFKRSVLHLATHGVIDVLNFNGSYVLLAEKPGHPGSGKLTMAELIGMDLSEVQMLVLSACNTGVSINADSVMVGASMSKVMTQAGIHTIIASLWPVDDEATSVLMTEFYRNLSSQPAVDALRNAQATLSNELKYRHPYFWGGFILIGDWR